MTWKKQNDIIFEIKGGIVMCKVKMDLNNDANLNFAIYSLVLSKREEFSAQELVHDVRAYQAIDEQHLYNTVSCLLKKWVNSGMIQEHLDTFSMV